MKHLIFSLAVLCLSSLSVFGQSQTFVLNANIHQNDYDGLYIYLTRSDIVNRQLVQKVDSAKIQNGQFHIEMAAPSTPYVATLALPPKDEHFAYSLPECLCIVEAGKVQLDYTPEGEKLLGGTFNQQYDDALLSFGRTVKVKADVLVRERDSLDSKKNLSNEEMEVYNRRLGEVYKELKPHHIQFVSENIHNDVGAYFFFSYPQDYYEADVYAKLSAQVNQDYLKRMDDKLKADIAAQQYEQKSREMTKEGHPYRDFTSFTVDGKQVKLSNYVRKGHVLLVDFFASWCVPCMMEVKDIRRLYETYHAKGLDIVSVSLDTKRPAWEAAIKKNALPWPQLSDLKGWNGQATKDYAIAAIPYIIVIDQNGKIAVCNLHSKLLESKIKNLLEK